MLKKGLIATVLLAIVLPAVAGDVKVHDPWPTMFVPVPVTTIQVCLDLGFYIHIKDQKCIKVVQDTSAADPYKTYTGCVTSAVESNFDATITASIKDTSPAILYQKIAAPGYVTTLRAGRIFPILARRRSVIVFAGYYIGTPARTRGAGAQSF